MSIIDGLTKKVATTAKTAVRKSGDIVEVTKLNMSVNSEEDKIHKSYFELGRAVYELFKNGEEFVEAAKAICEQIKVYEDNIKEIKLKILGLKNIKECPSCQMELDMEVAFCPKCGAKQEIPQIKEKSEGEEETK